MPKVLSKISQTPANRVMPHKGVMFFEGIPLDTKIQFKAVCAYRGETMRDAIIRLMREHISINRPTS